MPPPVLFISPFINMTSVLSISSIMKLLICPGRSYKQNYCPVHWSLYQLLPSCPSVLIMKLLSVHLFLYRYLHYIHRSWYYCPVHLSLYWYCCALHWSWYYCPVPWSLYRYYCPVHWSLYDAPLFCLLVLIAFFPSFYPSFIELKLTNSTYKVFKMKTWYINMFVRNAWSPPYG